MSDIPLNQLVYFDAITSHPTTAAATDADSTPTFEVFEENTDTDIGVGGNLTKRTSKTGNYRGSFTTSAANGFEVGKFYNVIGSATVNSIAGKGVLARFRVVAAETTVGKAEVGNTQEIANALLDLADGIETNRTPRKALRLILAALAGKLSGASTTTVVMRDTNDSKNRISATVDASGNRSSIVLDDT